MLGNTVENDFVKRTVNDKLPIKINAIGTKVSITAGLVPKTQYDSDKQNFEIKIDDIDKNISNTIKLASKTAFNTKVTEIENKALNINDLVTKPKFNKKLTETGNKIPSITGLDTAAALKTKTREMQNKLVLLKFLQLLLLIQKQHDME